MTRNPPGNDLTVISFIIQIIILLCCEHSKQVLVNPMKFSSLCVFNMNIKCVLDTLNFTKIELCAIATLKVSFSNDL